VQLLKRIARTVQLQAVRNRRKESFEVPGSSLESRVSLSTGKSDLLQKIFADIFRIEQWKNNGILFTKIGKLCFRYQRLTSVSQIKYRFSKSLVSV
jgi:hypothetical protein